MISSGNNSLLECLKLSSEHTDTWFLSDLPLKGLSLPKLSVIGVVVVNENKME